MAQEGTGSYYKSTSVGSAFEGQVQTSLGGDLNQLEHEGLAQTFWYLKQGFELVLRASVHQSSSIPLLQSLNTSAIGAGLPAVGQCEITSDALLEDAGGACGDDLTTVYDFWSASSRAFPGKLSLP